ncbi:hypothetical protein V6N13_143961 [Hibiscus sabdariffa]|uniref:phosphopantothenoylcysteine decarboxylase n=1 Tax=Hibiscus sabdariffa TaxID=183260 RepID=A0ABR2FIY8_9ROSI
MEVPVFVCRNKKGQQIIKRQQLLLTGPLSKAQLSLLFSFQTTVQVARTSEHQIPDSSLILDSRLWHTLSLKVQRERDSSEWAEVKAVATKASLHFIDRASLPKDLKLYTDEEEWSSWGKIGDSVLHIDLRRWADIMVITPLSANTLGKIAGGLCDNLLTCVIRAWDYSKPMFVAPAMNTFMWSNPFTEKHLMTIDELGISLIPPVSKLLACGDYGNGAMAEPSQIHSTVRLFLEPRTQPSD